MRDEYDTMYHRLCELFMTPDPGATVTGQPGISDRSLGCFCEPSLTFHRQILLRRCCNAWRRGKPCCLQRSMAFHICLTKAGSDSKKKKKRPTLRHRIFRPRTLPSPPRGIGCSSTDPGKGSGSSVLTNSLLFVILTVLPNEARYKEWRKQSGAFL